MSSEIISSRRALAAPAVHENPNAVAVKKPSLLPRWRQTLGDITNRASTGHNAFGFRRRRRARPPLNRKTFPPPALLGIPPSEIAPSLHPSIASAQSTAPTTGIPPAQPPARPEDGVCVAVRVRPISKRERAAGPGGAGSWLMDAKCMTQMTGNRAVVGNSFAFDNVFLPGTDNATVYAALAAPVVRTAVSGVNGVIFAYGQTAAGKTHTMLGTDADPGITRRAVIDVFDAIAVEPHRKFLMHASYIEIYNEVVRDLLDSSREPLRIHEDVANKRVQLGAREVAVGSVEEVMEILAMGEMARVVGETNMNERSSRSHTIFSLRVESRDADDGRNDVLRSSTLNLVDLAGSERAGLTKADGMRLKEGGHINKSLLALATVISKLSSGDCASTAHIPYRDSKLTRILQPALGGNARTAVVCAVSPSALHMDETLSTLRFASRAKKVRNQAKRNEFVDDDAKMRRAEMEIKRLMAENEGFRDRERVHVSEMQMQKDKIECCARANVALQGIVDSQKLNIQALEKDVAATSAEMVRKDVEWQELQKKFQDLQQRNPVTDSKCSVCKNSTDDWHGDGLNDSPRRVEDTAGSDIDASQPGRNERRSASTTSHGDEVNAVPGKGEDATDTRRSNFDTPQPIELNEELSVPPYDRTDDEVSDPVRKAGNTNNSSIISSSIVNELPELPSTAQHPSSAISRRDPLEATVDAIATMSDADLRALSEQLCETRGRPLCKELSRRFQSQQAHSGWRMEGFRPRGRQEERVKFLTTRVENIKRRLHEIGEKKWAARLKTTSLRDAMMGVHTVAEEIRGRCAEGAGETGEDVEGVVEQVLKSVKWSVQAESGKCPFVVTPGNQNDAVSALERLVEHFVGLAESPSQKDCVFRLNTHCLTNDPCTSAAEIIDLT